MSARHQEIKKRNGREITITQAPWVEKLDNAPPGTLYFGVYGGRASGKSHALARRLIIRCLKKPTTRAICLREVQLTLAESVKSLLEDIIREFKLSRHFQCLKTQINILCGTHRRRVLGRILFKGLQGHTVASIKSLEKFDIAWIEEGQTISKHSWKTLYPTLREDDSEIWVTWNPLSQKDPIDEFFRNKDAETDPEIFALEVNYRDNPWLSKKSRSDMERDRRRDPDDYAHIWLGKYLRRSAARVFRNWRIAAKGEIEVLLHRMGNRRVVYYYGADFGFSQDPTVLVRCFIVDRTLYVDREAVKVGLAIDATSDFWKQMDEEQARRWPITADSSDPQLIDYLRRHGFPLIRGAKKGPGSVEAGVTFLKSYDIVVHPDCVWTIDELASYSYKVEKKTEDVLPILEDKKNHVIDSLRYAIERLRPTKKAGVLFSTR